MKTKTCALLSLTLLLSAWSIQPLQAQPPQDAAPRPLAQAPEVEAYGWWHSKNDSLIVRPAMMGGARPTPTASQNPEQSREAGRDQAVAAEASGHPGGPQAQAGHPGAQAPPQSPGAEAVQDGDKNSQAAAPPANIPAGHSFARNRSPIQSLHLMVRGAEQPEKAPEVYYRFTSRTMERHGGVALGTSTHQAEVVWDEDSWRADIFGPSFGTVEVFSRFELAGRPVYSQYNYLHFLRQEDAEGLELPAKVEMPADWPQFVFPTSSYNDMPFRGVQTGQSVEFEIAAQSSAPEKALVLEAGGEAPISLSSSLARKFSFAPLEDTALAEAGSRGSKRAIVLATVPHSREVLTFGFSISRSRWSTRKLGYGLGALAGVALITSVIVIRRRRRFKYNDLD